MKTIYLMVGIFLLSLAMVSAGECDDGTDNDGDGTVDTGDVGCSSASDLTEIYDCSDGIDNDRDGVIDLFGSCLSSGEYVSCTNPSCQSSCTASGGVYYSKDDGCKSPGDDSEDSQSGGTTTSSTTTSSDSSISRSSSDSSLGGSSSLKTGSSYKTGRRAAEYDTESILPWVFVVVGVLLLAGVSYWYFTKKNSAKKLKKK